MRTVVLDVKLAAAPVPAVTAPPVENGGPFPWLATGALSLGGVALLVGAGADGFAAFENASITDATSQLELNEKQQRRTSLLAPVAVVGYATGALLAGAGALLFVLGVE
jgi:hypothetical protein